MSTAPSAVTQDSKLQAKLQQAQNVAPLESKVSTFGMPDPVASNAELQKEHPNVYKVLLNVVKRKASQILVARRENIYRAGRAELYNIGKQYIFWNGMESSWMGVTPNGVNIDAHDSECDSIDRVYNFYKAYQESFSTTASQTVPDVIFHPEDASRREDIEAAKDGTDASELLSRQNDAPMILEKIAYHGFTGGTMVTYARQVTDGNRFGYEVDPQTGQPTNNPRSQVLISVHGALDIALPPLADCQADCDWADWHLEVPTSLAKATYPWASTKISASGSMSDDDLLARLFRTAVRSNIQPAMPSDSMDGISTIARIWLRPSTYWCGGTDAEIAETQQMFPRGVCVHWAGGAFVAAIPENMDDHLSIEFACEGRGTCRPGIGDSFMDVQDEINVLSNLFNEYLVYGIPPIIHNSKAINKEAIQQMVAKVAQWIPSNMPDPSTPMSDQFWQPVAAMVPEALISRLDALGGMVGQFLLGVYPALTGGAAEGAVNETKGGLQIQLQQSMGRIALFYRRVRSLYQKTMLKAVREFAASQDTDVSLSSQDPMRKPRKINPIAIRKGSIAVYVEADEGAPVMFADKRQAITQFMQLAAGDEEMAKSLDVPQNQSTVKAAFGVSDWVVIGDASRLKQMKEIDDLLSAGPSQDPETGQPVASVPIQPLDYDQEELDTCRTWATSDEGQEALVNNTDGYDNVMAHAAAHQARLSQNAQQAAESQAQLTRVAKSKLPEPPQQKPPTESINYKDVPPDVQKQMAAQAGLQQSDEDTQAGHVIEVAKDLATQPPKPKKEENTNA